MLKFIKEIYPEDPHLQCIKHVYQNMETKVYYVCDIYMSSTYEWRTDTLRDAKDMSGAKVINVKDFKDKRISIDNWYYKL
jgi:hypothetical protein